MEERLVLNEHLEKNLIKSESLNALLNEKLNNSEQGPLSTKTFIEQEQNTLPNESEKVFTMIEMKKVLIQLNETQKLLNKKCK